MNFKKYMESVIEEYRKSVKGLNDTITNIDAKEQELYFAKLNGLIPTKERNDNVQRIEKELADLKKEKFAIEYNFRDYLGKCKRFVSDEFGEKIDPNMIDNNALLILDNDVLKVSEYESFANKYADNPTMKRLIAAKLRKKAEGFNDKHARVGALTLSQKIERSSNAAYDIIDSFESFAILGITGNKPIGVRNGMNKEIEKRIPSLLEKCESVKSSDE